MLFSASKMTLKIGAFAALIVLTSAFGTAHAASKGDPDAVIKYRKGVMDTIGANTEAVAGILSGKLPYQNSLAQHAQALATAAGWATQAFSQNTDGQGHERTTAKADIWTNAAKFNGDLKDLQTATQKLATAANAGNMAATVAAFKPMLKTCKSCHDDFRTKH